MLLATCGDTYCECVCRASDSPRRCSHRVDSPWTAIVFLSCRMLFPADTCTVTVLTPSLENVHATLPSRVITGCWGRHTQIERVRVWAVPGESVISSWLTSHMAVVYTAEVSACWHTHKHTHEHAERAGLQRDTNSSFLPSSSSLSVL